MSRLMPVSHQTIKLSAGRHRGPEDGACAMELASMLAGEPFGDHPRSVCPVIAGFLRSYNDHIDERRRQDLYAYAAQAVGTRADAATERARGLRYAGGRLEISLILRRCTFASCIGCSAARASTSRGCTWHVPPSQPVRRALPIAARSIF